MKDRSKRNISKRSVDSEVEWLDRTIWLLRSGYLHRPHDEASESEWLKGFDEPTKKLIHKALEYLEFLDMKIY